MWRHVYVSTYMYMYTLMIMPRPKRTLFELTWDRGTGRRDVNNMNIRRMVQTHRRSGKEPAIQAVCDITCESARDASGSPPAVVFGQHHGSGKVVVAHSGGV